MAEGGGHGVPMLDEALLFLTAAVVVALLLHRLRVTPVLGYLLAGLLIGPSGLGYVTKVEEVRSFAELGVVFLLFVIGLGMSAERLKAMGRWGGGLGGMQVLVTGAVITAIAYGFGNPVSAAVVLGGCFALSSTAMVIHLLAEQGEVASPTGRVTFAVLLFQDLAAVPILLLVSVLSSPGGESIFLTLAMAAGKAVLAVVLILLVGRFTLRPLLHYVAGTRNGNLFTATALLIVLGTGWVTSQSGLSAALGAFLAGMVLARTEFRHQVEADIEPFKGLLLGLFFLTVGLGLDIRIILEQFVWVVASVAGLILLKSVIAGVLARLFKAPRDVAIRTGLLLGEVGEFAFVGIGMAQARGLIASEAAQFMFAVIGLSMAATPLLPKLAEVIIARLDRARAEGNMPGGTVDQDGLTDHVIVTGFGRVGRTVAQLLARQRVPFVAVDLNPELVKEMNGEGQPVHFGDGSQPEVLKQLGADRAAAVIITLDQPESAERAVGTIRHHWPHLRILARSRDRDHAAALTSLGAGTVVPETFDSSLALARGALESLGVPPLAIEELVTRYRESDRTRP